MDDLNISLPAEMHRWIDERIASGNFMDAGDYIRDLIRHDQQSEMSSAMGKDQSAYPSSPNRNEYSRSDAMISETYDPNRFSDVAGQWGDRLWAFFNREAVVSKMVAASVARRPAVEGIGPEYLEEFGEAGTADRVKQFAGALVKQIMERHGFQWESSGHPIRRGGPFSTGSRYTRTQR